MTRFHYLSFFFLLVLSIHGCCQGKCRLEPFVCPISLYYVYIFSYYFAFKWILIKCSSKFLVQKLQKLCCCAIADPFAINFPYTILTLLMSMRIGHQAQQRRNLINFRLFLFVCLGPFYFTKQNNSIRKKARPKLDNGSYIVHH